MSRNSVVLVDEQDNPLGVQDKMAAHVEGALHRAFSIFVLRRRQGKLELLLQQRAHHKYHCGGLWSNSCCSHPQAGESLTDSAVSRLREELGFSLPLTWVGSHKYRAELANGLVEHEFDHLFVGWYADEPILANPDEVDDTAWLALDELQQQLEQHPERFTPWFAGTFAKVAINLQQESAA